MHKDGIVHGQIRPRNVLIGNVKGRDFRLMLAHLGILKIKSVSQIVHNCGDAYYLAPEMMINECDAASDIWAVGVIAFVMATGQPPYRGSSNREILTNINNCADKSRELKHVNQGLKQLILSMLQFNKADRPTAE